MSTVVSLAEVRRLYVDEGLSGQATAQQLGVSRQSVYRYLERLGIDRRGPGRPDKRSIVDPKMDQRIRELYRVNDGCGMTIAEIAAELDVSFEFVRQRMVALGVRRRPRGRRSGVTSLLTDEQLEQTERLYHEHGLVETCRLLGLTDGTVRYRLSRVGITATRRTSPTKETR